MSGVKGQLSKLHALVAAAESMAGTGFMVEVSEEIAEEALDRVKQTFSEATDPYGNAWPPLKQDRSRNIQAGERTGKNRSSLLLRDTGRMYNSIATADISATGFFLTASTEYAAVHNFGHQFAPRQQKISVLDGGMAVFVPNSTPDVPQVKEVTLNISIPKRQFIPSNGLPSSWRAEFQSILSEKARGVLGQ